MSASVIAAALRQQVDDDSVSRAGSICTSNMGDSFAERVRARQVSIVPSRQSSTEQHSTRSRARRGDRTAPPSELGSTGGGRRASISARRSVNPLTVEATDAVGIVGGGVGDLSTASSFEKDQVLSEAHIFDTYATYPPYIVDEQISKMSLKQKIHALFDAEGLAESFYAERYRIPSMATFILTLLLILTSVVVITIESLPQFHKKDNLEFLIIEVTCIIWFTFEMAVRFITDSNKRKFIKDPLNWVDLVSVLPSYIDWTLQVVSNSEGSGGMFVVLRVVRLARVFRVFKLSKYSEGIQVVGAALRRSSDALSLLLFLTGVTVVIFGSMLFFVEQSAATFIEADEVWVRNDGTGLRHHYQSQVDTFWWCMVTVTTVGYGDKYPVTTLGYLVATGAMLSGIIIAAFPIIILGANFSEAREAQLRKKQVERLNRLDAIGVAEQLSPRSSTKPKTQAAELLRAGKEPLGSPSESNVSGDADILEGSDSITLEELQEIREGGSTSVEIIDGHSRRRPPTQGSDTICRGSPVGRPLPVGADHLNAAVELTAVAAQRPPPVSDALTRHMAARLREHLDPRELMLMSLTRLDSMEARVCDFAERLDHVCVQQAALMNSVAEFIATAEALRGMSENAPHRKRDHKAQPRSWAATRSQPSSHKPPAEPAKMEVGTDLKPDETGFVT